MRTILHLYVQAGVQVHACLLNLKLETSISIAIEDLVCVVGKFTEFQDVFVLSRVSLDKK
jgi:hypothetical protein